MDPLLDIVLIPYKEEYLPELTDLLATAFMLNNPFIKPLNLSKAEMILEFERTIKSGLFNIILVFADRAKFQKGEVEIIATWCFGDLFNFFPQGEVNMENTNFDIVPTLAKVRLYMRYKSIKPIYDKFHPQKGQIGYADAFCVKPTYQRKGLTYQAYYLGYQHLIKSGVTKYIGHAINPIMQANARKSVLFSEEIIVDVSDIYVQETQSKPYVGLNLCQIVFPIDIEKTYQLVVDLITKQYQQQPAL